MEARSIVCGTVVLPIVDKPKSLRDAGVAFNCGVDSVKYRVESPLNAATYESCRAGLVLVRLPRGIGDGGYSVTRI